MEKYKVKTLIGLFLTGGLVIADPPQSGDGKVGRFQVIHQVQAGSFITPLRIDTATGETWTLMTYTHSHRSGHKLAVLSWVPVTETKEEADQVLRLKVQAIEASETIAADFLNGPRPEPTPQRKGIAAWLRDTNGIPFDVFMSTNQAPPSPPK